MKILLLVCALWSSMYINPANGAGSFILDVGDLAKDDNQMYNFDCYGTCEITKIVADYLSGLPRFRGYAEINSDSFCENSQNNPASCVFKKDNQLKPTGNSFSLTLFAQEATTNLEITVSGNVKSAKLHIGQAAEPFRVDVGNLVEGESRLYRFDCDGICGITKIFANYLSGLPRFRGYDKLGSGEFCANSANNPARCAITNNQLKPTGNSFYLTLWAKEESKNVEIAVRGNVKSATLQSRHVEEPFRLDVGNLGKGHNRMYRFDCDGTCDITKIVAKYLSGLPRFRGYAKKESGDYFCSNSANNPSRCAITNNHLKPTGTSFFLTLYAQEATTNLEIAVSRNVKSATLISRYSA